MRFITHSQTRSVIFPRSTQQYKLIYAMIHSQPEKQVCFITKKQLQHCLTFRKYLFDCSWILESEKVLKEHLKHSGKKTTKNDSCRCCVTLCYYF